MKNLIFTLINDFLMARLDAKAADFIRNTQLEIQGDVEDARFTSLISLASRYIPRQLLMPTSNEVASAQKILAGWNPNAWSMLEAARITLILSRNDLLSNDFPDCFNRWFNYADEGELCALYRAIPLLPEPQRFVWRAAEGCRTNMKSVFTAVTCDSPFPQKYFDDVAWNQLLVKALFTETPLTRVYGLDLRISTTLSHMVLDYMDERSSAGREIPLDSWLCLGESTDARFEKFVKIALKSSSLKNGASAIVALGRAKKIDALQSLRDKNVNPHLQAVIIQVLNGRVDQIAFQELVSQVDG